MNMKRLLSYTVAIAVFSLAPALTAQSEAPAQSQQVKAEPAKAAEQTLQGCLMEGQQGAYLLKTDKGEQIEVTGSSGELLKHVNHTIELTGTMSKEGDDKSFRVSKIKHIAASCKG